MPNWTNLTLAGLRAASKADIIRDVAQYIAEHFTKRQIIIWLMDAERIQDRVRVTRDDLGRITHRQTTWSDIVTGNVVMNHDTIYTYYPTGEIEDITIIHRDGDGNITEQYTIHHYTDGRQPVRLP